MSLPHPYSVKQQASAHPSKQPLGHSTLKLWWGDPTRDARWCEARYQLERLHTYLWTFESVMIRIIYIMLIWLYQIISRSELMLVWLYHISMILTEVIPICSPQLQPGVAWQVPIRGRITLVADHVTEFYGCSGRVLRSPLALRPIAGQPFCVSLLILYFDLVCHCLRCLRFRNFQNFEDWGLPVKNGKKVWLQ